MVTKIPRSSRYVLFSMFACDWHGSNIPENNYAINTVRWPNAGPASHDVGPALGQRTSVIGWPSPDVTTPLILSPSAGHFTGHFIRLSELVRKYRLYTELSLERQTWRAGPWCSSQRCLPGRSEITGSSPIWQSSFKDTKCFFSAHS